MPEILRANQGLRANPSPEIRGVAFVQQPVGLRQGQQQFKFGLVAGDTAQRSNWVTT